MLTAMHGPAHGAATGGPSVMPVETRLRALLRDDRVRHVLGVLALALLYRGAAEIGYSLQFAGPVAAIVWLPVGIGAAFLYHGGLRYWPGVLIGDLLANDYMALPLGSALAQTCGNVLEVVLMTLLLRRLVPRGDPLGTARGVIRMLIAIGAGAAVSASIGTLSSLGGDVIQAGDVAGVWRTWWLGDSTGALVVLPLALAWARPPSAVWWRERGVELAAAIAAIVLVGELALRSNHALAYLVFPMLIWAALRLGRPGATLAVGVAAGFAIWETTRQVGPFAFESVTESVLSTQLYIAVAAVSTLCLGAVVVERERAISRLAASRRRLVTAGDNERRRIEHNLHDGAQQRLTALVVQLNMYAERARVSPGIAAGMLEDAGVELSLAIDELRELAYGIHPSALGQLGLAEVLRGLAMRSAIPIRLLELPERRLDETVEATAYFIVAEAVNNARKYAGADVISVWVGETRGKLHAIVEDDGAGGAVARPGSGLEGLHDRVEAVGGELEVISPPGRGTRIVASIPAAPAA
jgi:signal transduction histidine kinase